MDLTEIDVKISLIQAEIKFRSLQLQELQKEFNKLLIKRGKMPEVIAITNNGNNSPVKELSSPVQTAAGKDISSPLLAESLPKTLVTHPRPDSDIKAAHEHKLQVQEVNLRPSKASKKYYTVFSGPNKGVYTNWGTVAALTIGRPWSFKSYDTEKEALIALNEAKAEKEVPERTFKQTVEARSKTQSLNRMMRKDPAAFKAPGPKKVKPVTFTFTDFAFYFNMAESQTMDEAETYFTINKKKVSLFGFRAGAKPEMVRDTFNAGLCSVIYPSANL